MVLYKRKPVTFVRPPPIPQDLDTEIYVISQTKEWFVDYEEFLARLDYYHRKKFVCEITGNSCLTFFEAYDSELKEIADLESSFPEALREHILKYLQFNRISRLDVLVDKVYLIFKNEYYPGEEVFVKKLLPAASEKNAFNTADQKKSQLYLSSVKQRGVIREKVEYSNPADTKYLVSTASGASQIIATNQQISRDRNHFTKWLVKTYVKLTVTRCPKVGAPWVVKEKFAKKYNIPSEYPEDLKHFELLTPRGDVLYEGDTRLDSPTPFTDTQDVAKGKKIRGKLPKKKGTQVAASAVVLNLSALNENDNNRATSKGDHRNRFPLHHLPTSIQKELDDSEAATLSSFQPSRKTIVDDLSLAFDLQVARPTPSLLYLLENASVLNKQVAAKVAEDCEADDTIAGAEKDQKLKQIKALQRPTLQAVQEALESWVFLNIYHSVLNIDTFTFDDFVCAMGWNDEQLKEDGRCELLDEIWCAVLSLIVSNEIPSTKAASGDKVHGLQITLPPDVKFFEDCKDKQYEDDKGSESDEEPRPLKIEDEVSDTESAQHSSPNQNGKSSESQLADVKQETADQEMPDSDPEEDGVNTTEDGVDEEHNAFQVMNYRGIKWHEKLRKRSFKDGNWQTISLGVLSLVDYVPEYSSIIHETYEVLAPSLISPASPSTVLSQFYTFMSVDLRLKVLHILVSLIVNGHAVRAYIDESLDASVTLRRSRLDTIRDLKASVDHTNKLHNEIYQCLMDGVNSAEDQSLWSSFSRKKHRLNIQGYQMTPYEEDLAAKNEEFKTLWLERDAGIEKIKELRQARKEVEMKLSELDCQRVRLLGKDRHFNRYWWFENNGLPNLQFSVAGDDDDEQQDADSDDDLDDKEESQEETYLMGRLWIQGPSSMDALSNLKLSSEDAQTIGQRLQEAEEQASMSNIDDDKQTVTELAPSEGESGNQNLKVLNFEKIPVKVKEEAKQFGLVYGKDAITFVDSTTVIDNVGGLAEKLDLQLLSPIQRKFIEESPMPLFTGLQWAFFENPQDIEDLIKWLNPWGKRESGLRKEMMRVKEGMMASISARRKALWKDKLPKEGTEMEATISAVDTKLEQLKSGDVAEETATDDGADDINPRKRPYRKRGPGPNKRQKTTEETIKSGTVDELTKLKDVLQEELSEKMAHMQNARVLEWVNRSAVTKFDKSLYEGGEKAKPKPRKARK